MPYILTTAIIVLTLILAIQIGRLYKHASRSEIGRESVLGFAQKQRGWLQEERGADLEEICLHLIGAVDFIGKKRAYSVQKRRILIVKVLKACLGLSAKEVSHFYAVAVKREPGSAHEQFIRSGAKAAKQWLIDQNRIKQSDEKHDFSGMQLSAS